MKRLAVFVLIILGLGLGLGLAPAVAAASHTILVLPVDGTADAATRAKLTARIVKLSKGLDGQVSTAQATFADTALAVGCEPQAPGCSEQVIATLGVDELVWATATQERGQTKLVVRRTMKGAATRELSMTIAWDDAPARIDAAMAPLFTPSSAAPESAVSGPTAPTPGPRIAPPSPTGEIVPEQVPPGRAGDHRDRTAGIAFAAGGGVALVLGLALWGSYASLQESIDNHPTSSRGDFDDLKALEDRAATYAITGDCLVVVGLAAGGLGAYYLYRDHRRHIAVTPAPIGNGAGLTLTIPGGL